MSDAITHTDDTPLELRSADGRVTATVFRRAAALRGLVVDGCELVEPMRTVQLGAGMAGAVMAPWPNRVEGAIWQQGETVHHLTVTEPARGNALHGLLTDHIFAVSERAADAVTLVAQIEPQPGYPFSLEMAVDHCLAEDGIRTTVTMTNLGEEACPVAFGGHPYLRVGDVGFDQLRVYLDANVRHLLDDSQIPRQAVAMTRAEVDPCGLQPAGALPAHATFELRNAARPLCHLVVGPDGRGVAVVCDPILRWTQLFVAPALQTDTGTRTAISIEPMSAPPNALRSGTDLQTLAPGASWGAGWSLLFVSDAPVAQ